MTGGSADPGDVNDRLRAELEGRAKRPYQWARAARTTAQPVTGSAVTRASDRVTS